MPYNVKFDFCRPLGSRIVDIDYVSPAICPALYYSAVASSSTADGADIML